MSCILNEVLTNSFVKPDSEPIEKEEGDIEEEESYDFSGDSESDVEPSLESENSELSEDEYDYNNKN